MQAAIKHFLINNDLESIKKLETMQSLFPKNIQRILIFGTTNINNKKA
jgi:hypothetical protein